MVTSYELDQKIEEEEKASKDSKKRKEIFFTLQAVLACLTTVLAAIAASKLLKSETSSTILTLVVATVSALVTLVTTISGFRADGTIEGMHQSTEISLKALRTTLTRNAEAAQMIEASGAVAPGPVYNQDTIYDAIIAGAPNY